VTKTRLSHSAKRWRNMAFAGNLSSEHAITGMITED